MLSKMFLKTRRAFSINASTYKYISFEKSGKVGIIRLNDEKRLNALTAEMGDEFVDLINKICLDCSDINAVILTGQGRAFSAGGDLKFLMDRSKDTPSRNAVIMRRFYERFLSIRKLPVPTIACINGPAIGAGLCLALACDLRVVTEDTQIGLTFVKIGLHPGMGSTHTLRNIVGTQIAARLLLTGDVITGKEAKELGVVLSSHPKDKVLEEALILANRIADASSVATRSCIKSLRLQDDESFDRSLWREADAQSQSYASKDLVEGVTAVAEKRKANFITSESLKE